MITKIQQEVISEKPEIIAEKPIDEKPIEPIIPIEPIEIPKPTYTISRYEQNGDSLFICLNSTEAPVYLEHYFIEEEKLDIPASITKLVAELELMAEAYQAPIASINRLEEIKDMEIGKEDVVIQKALIVERRAKETPQIKQENELQDTQLA